MPISVQCPSCAKRLKTKDELAGKKIKCPGCGQVLPVPGGAPAGEPSRIAPSIAPATKNNTEAVSGWSEETKGTLCYFFGAPFFLIGGICLLQNLPGPALLSGILLGAGFVGAVNFKYHKHSTMPTTPLALLGMAFFSLAIIVAALGMMIFGWELKD